MDAGRANTEGYLGATSGLMANREMLRRRRSAMGPGWAETDDPMSGDLFLDASPSETSPATAKRAAARERRTVHSWRAAAAPASFGAVGVGEEARASFSCAPPSGSLLP